MQLVIYKLCFVVNVNNIVLLIFVPVQPQCPADGSLEMTSRYAGCPGSVITVLMLSPLKVQYCDNWRMAANWTQVTRSAGSAQMHSCEYAARFGRVVLNLTVMFLQILYFVSHIMFSLINEEIKFFFKYQNKMLFNAFVTHCCTEYIYSKHAPGKVFIYFDRDSTIKHATFIGNRCPSTRGFCPLTNLQPCPWLGI